MDNEKGACFGEIQKKERVAALSMTTKTKGNGSERQPNVEERFFDCDARPRYAREKQRRTRLRSE
jgi:hypothetical protein